MRSRISHSLVEYVLLGFLEQASHHGYDLYKILSSYAEITFLYPVKRSQLYAILAKMETDGLIESKTVPGEGYPPRKQLHITEIGRRVFSIWCSSPNSRKGCVNDEFMAKLYFATASDAQLALDLLDRQQAECLERLKAKRARTAALQGEWVYERMALQMHIYQAEAFLRWLEECRRAIQDDVIQKKKEVPDSFSR